MLYLALAGFPTQTLTRFSDTNWVLAPYPFVGGPLQDMNANATTVTASSAGGVVTLTASAPIFDANSVGSLFKLTPDAFTTSPWQPHTAVNIGDRCMSNGNSYVAISGNPNGPVPWNGTSQLYTGTTAPDHDTGSAYDGSGDTLNPATGSGFVYTGVGWQFETPGYGVVLITGFTDTQHVTGQVLPFRNGTTAATLPAEVASSANPTGTFTVLTGIQVEVAGSVGGITDGTPVVLTTSGTLPAPLALATTYYIVNYYVFKGNTLFAFSATPGGTPINMTTAGTGTQTFTATTAGTTLWAFGVWGADPGYPNEVEFFRNRLGLLLTATVSL